jgi:predicted ATPase
VVGFCIPHPDILKETFGPYEMKATMNTLNGGALTSDKPTITQDPNGLVVDTVKAKSACIHSAFYDPLNDGGNKNRGGSLNQEDCATSGFLSVATTASASTKTDTVISRPSSDRNIGAHNSGGNDVDSNGDESRDRTTASPPGATRRRGRSGTGGSFTAPKAGGGRPGSCIHDATRRSSFSSSDSIATDNDDNERSIPIHKSRSIRTSNTSGGRSILDEFTINKLQFGAIKQLFGRDKEIDLLQKVYDAMAASRDGIDGNTLSPTKRNAVGNNCSSSVGYSKQIVIVGGAPGSGKSLLTMDTFIPLCQRGGGFFVSGKFSVGNSYGGRTSEQAPNKDAEAYQQRHETQPYSGIRDAFTNLVDDILMVYDVDANEEQHVMDPPDKPHNSVDHLGPSYDSVRRGGQPSTMNLPGFGGHRSSQRVPDNHHCWKVSIEQMRSVWAQEKENLEVLTPIVNNIDRLWGRSGKGAADPNEDDNTIAKTDTTGFAGSKQAIHYAFARFLMILGDMAPLVMLLDDLQWADPASLTLLESLMADERLKRLLFVGTIRNDAKTNAEYTDTNMDMIVKRFAEQQHRANDLTRRNFALHIIKIEPLTVHDVALWVQALLDIPADKATDLAECVHRRTAGNPLYVKEFLLSLSHAGLLEFNLGLMKWQYNIEQILTETVAAQNVVSILRNRMDSLPPIHRAILPKVACIGSALSYHMFQVLVEDTLGKELEGGDDTESGTLDLGVHHSKAQAILDNLESEGMLIVDSKRKFIKWAHDTIREAALRIIGEDESALAQVQYAVGRLLLAHPKQEETETSRELFIMTNLLNSGAKDMASGSLRNDIIYLNIQAGETALHASDFGSAAWYFTKGIELLPVDDQKWDKQWYQMTLDLYSGSSVAHFLKGQHDVVEELKHQVILGSGPETPIIKLRRLYDAHIDSLSAQGRLVEALEVTEQTLKVLGCRFPKSGRTVRTIVALIGLTTTVDKQIKKMAELKPCEDVTVEWIMSLLNRMAATCIQVDPGLLPLAYDRALKYTLNHGISEHSSSNLSCIGMVLAAFMGNFTGGQKYCDLAHRCMSRNTEARTIAIANIYVYHLLMPFESCKKPLLKAYEAGLRSGDLEGGFWAIYQFLEMQLFTGARLSELLRDLDTYCWQMKVHHHDKILRFTLVNFQLVFNLANSGSHRHILTGKLMDETKLEALVRGNSDCTLDWIHYSRHKLQAAFWFGEHQLVADIIEREGHHKFAIEKINPGDPAMLPMYVQCALSSVSVYRKTGAKKHKKRAVIFHQKIKDMIRRGNKNVIHSEALIKAELCGLTVRRRTKRAKIVAKNVANAAGRGGAGGDPAPHCYDQAIVLAGRLGLTSDQALAHERAADYALGIGDMNDAKYHYEKALVLYADWGARGKVEQLEEYLWTIPDLAPATSMVLQGNDNMSGLSSFSFGVR